jgi:hypothetical protein
VRNTGDLLAFEDREEQDYKESCGEIVHLYCKLMFRGWYNGIWIVYEASIQNCNVNPRQGCAPKSKGSQLFPVHVCFMDE